MAILNKLFNYSLEGLHMRRANPDGTPSLPERTLGFSGTIDLSGFGGTTAELTIKVDGVEETKTIDWTAALDPAAVTVAEFVTAFNLALFTEVGAAIDSITTRLLIDYTGVGTPKYLQIYDGVDIGFAAILDFGQGKKYGGNGTKIVVAFDNVISVAMPKNIKDKEEIESESGDGTLKSVIIEALTKGLNPVLTFNDDDFQIKQLVMGGVYDSIENSYIPPTTDQVDKPIFTTEVFVPLYEGASNPREDKQGFKQTILWSCTGNEGDDTNETKTIANFTFNLSSGEYKDENGITIPYKKEINLTPEQYEALDVENL